ncbi:hypothetical protein HY256_00575 [Candidatus Sumerlaeota bacterium]|nr:hypothetical protein [Candidatus Sumerlaeota bacterium]
MTRKAIWSIPAGVAGLILFAGALRADNTADQTPTFTRDVAPILQRKCQECHRPGQIAPMAMMTYDETRPWAKSIREQVSAKRMPPWPAAPADHPFANDRSLSENEIATLTHWVDAGAPKGEDSDMPPPAKFSEGWLMGEPDLIVGMDAPFTVAAQGNDDYRCFVLDPQLTSDRWVSGVEIQPGNRTMDHHIVLYVDKGGKTGAKNDAADPNPGYECFGGPGFQASQLAGWGPGLSAKNFPEGVGHLIPAGGKIVMQMHYHRTGKPELDQTKVGLYFAKKPVHKALRDGIALNFNLAIQPGDANSVAEAERKVLEDITVHSVAPHMHLLGKSAEMWATLPGGDRLNLVSVPRWDFNWQTEYSFVEPLKIPRGSTIHVRCVFDNSAENPFQQVKPPKLVTFGEQTTDEMCVGVYFYTKDSEELAEGSGTVGR